MVPLQLKLQTLKEVVKVKESVVCLALIKFKFISKHYWQCETFFYCVNWGVVKGWKTCRQSIVCNGLVGWKNGWRREGACKCLGRFQHSKL